MTHSSIASGAHRALICLCILATLGGCAGRGPKCNKPGVYTSTAAGPPLRVPPDLSQPVESDTFDIPPGPTGAATPPCGYYPPKIAETAAKPGAGTTVAAPPTAEATPALPLPAPAPAAPATAAPPVVSEELQSELSALVVSWAESWTSGDFERYLQYYSHDFEPPGGLSIEDWQVARRGRLEKHPTTTVYPDTLSIEEASAERVVVHFVQRSELDGVVSSLRKGLELVREGDAWRIRKELIVEVMSNPR